MPLWHITAPPGDPGRDAAGIDIGPQLYDLPPSAVAGAFGGSTAYAPGDAPFTPARPLSRFPCASASALVNPNAMTAIAKPFRNEPRFSLLTIHHLFPWKARNPAKDVLASQPGQLSAGL